MAAWLVGAFRSVRFLMPAATVPTTRSMAASIDRMLKRPCDVPSSRVLRNGAFMDIGSREKWLYTHGRHEWDVMNSDEAKDYQRAFFDRFLKGVPDAMADKPRVRLEIRKRGHEVMVRAEDEWPLARTVYTPLYLDLLTRTLTPNALTAPALAQYNSTRDDALDFHYRFDEDTEITGHTKLRLWVSIDTGLDMDIFVALRKIDQEGNVV